MLLNEMPESEKPHSINWYVVQEIDDISKDVSSDSNHWYSFPEWMWNSNTEKPVSAYNGAGFVRRVLGLCGEGSDPWQNRWKLFQPAVLLVTLSIPLFECEINSMNIW